MDCIVKRLLLGEKEDSGMEWVQGRERGVLPKFPYLCSFPPLSHSQPTSCAVFSSTTFKASISQCKHLLAKFSSSSRAPSQKSSIISMAGVSTTSEARVLITQCDYKGDNVGDCGLERHFLHLRNPVSGLAVCYVVAPDGRLQELNWSKQRHTTWFIDNSVCADGSLYLATPIDPLFVILPILEQLRMKKGDDLGKFRSLDDIVSVDGYPGYVCLLPYLQRSLEIICESREVGQVKYYRLDDLKLVSWLLCKVTRLSEALQFSSGLFQGLHTNDLNVYVVKMLGEYLKMDPWITTICKHMGVDMDVLKAARVALPPSMPPPSRTQESKGNKQNGPAVKKAALSKNSKQSGGQKITSFFSKPR